MIWKVPEMWKGGECFIIGGGPSMPRQFGVPESVIKSVINKTESPSIYSSYLSALHSKHIIGVNAAFLIGSWIEVCFFGDAGFFLGNIANLAKFPGLKVSTNSAVQSYPWVKYLKQRNDLHPGKKHTGITTERNSLVWPLNSGGAAINLAVLFGVKRIILLGFDFDPEEKYSHWHSAYRPKDISEYHGSFAKHLRYFPGIAEDARKLGVEVLNANPKSHLNVFKKIKISDVL